MKKIDKLLIAKALKLKPGIEKALQGESWGVLYIDRGSFSIKGTDYHFVITASLKSTIYYELTDLFYYEKRNGVSSKIPIYLDRNKINKILNS